MVDERFIHDEMTATMRSATLANARLRDTPKDSPGYQEALNAYLSETIKYMAMVSVAQARQHELLTAEVAELRARLDAVLGASTLH